MFLTPNQLYFEFILKRGFDGLLDLEKFEEIELHVLQDKSARNDVYEITQGVNKYILKQPKVFSDNIFFGFNREALFYKSDIKDKDYYLSKTHRYIVFPKKYDITYTFLTKQLLFVNNKFDITRFNILKTALQTTLINFYEKTNDYRGTVGVPEYELMLGRIKNYYTFNDQSFLFENKDIRPHQKWVVTNLLNASLVKDFIVSSNPFNKSSIIHGDLFLRNVLSNNYLGQFESSQSLDLRIVDFENLAQGDSIYDMTTLFYSITSILSNTFRSHDPIKEIFIELLDMYKEIDCNFKTDIEDRFFRLFLLLRINRLMYRELENTAYDTAVAIRNLISRKDEEVTMLKEGKPSNSFLNFVLSND